jgi:hypothetical protein
MPQHPDRLNTTSEARAGETARNVRYLLLFVLGGVIMTFILLLFASY